jgi:hypothetical protein
VATQAHTEGNITVVGDGGHVALASGDDLAIIWSRFAATGSVAAAPAPTKLSSSGKNAAGGSDRARARGGEEVVGASESSESVDSAQSSSGGGAYGVVSVSATVAPLSAKTVTVVLGWHFPNRWHFGENIGNRYAATAAARGNGGSISAATSVANRLPAVLAGIIEWHNVCQANTLDPLLRDFYVNSVATLAGDECSLPFLYFFYSGNLSDRSSPPRGEIAICHRLLGVNIPTKDRKLTIRIGIGPKTSQAKTGVWASDGDFRQFESFSADDIDPVHIHLYRSFPTATFWPELERNLLEGYARAQLPTGYIRENPPFGGQTAEGRMMGDTSTAFVLAVLQLWQTGGAPLPWLRQIYPSVAAAVGWQLSQSIKYGLPTRLQTSYDWFGFDTADLCSYNAFMHLAALRAAEALAAVVGDRKAAAAASAGLARGTAALKRYLWRPATPATAGPSFFRASWSADGSLRDALLTDTLYGP